MLLTLNDGQQNDNHEKEEGDVKDHTIKLVLVPGRILDLISNTATGSHAHVHVEQITLRERDEGMSDARVGNEKREATPNTHAYSHHVITLHIRFIFILAHVVELAEKVEGHHGVEVDHHSQQTHRHHQLNHSQH